MYRRKQERAKRNAAISDELNASALAAWTVCAQACRALLTLGKDPAFRRLVDGHRGLLEVLPALLASSRAPGRADALLHLAVARAALAPLLVRVEVLGWMARVHPQLLVALLAVVAGDRDRAAPSDLNPGARCCLCSDHRRHASSRVGVFSEVGEWQCVGSNASSETEYRGLGGD